MSPWLRRQIRWDNEGKKGNSKGTPPATSAHTVRRDCYCRNGLCSHWRHCRDHLNQSTNPKSPETDICSLLLLPPPPPPPPPPPLLLLLLLLSPRVFSTIWEPGAGYSLDYLRCTQFLQNWSYRRPLSNKRLLSIPFLSLSKKPLSKKRPLPNKRPPSLSRLAYGAALRSPKLETLFAGYLKWSRRPCWPLGHLR